MDVLPHGFYDRLADEVAPDLLGMHLVREIDGRVMVGRIVEVEAYLGPPDLAAHSTKGRTKRTSVMYGPPGFAYVYRSYGIHWCLNFVCEPAGSASAVLLRALAPTDGLERMRRRRGLRDERALCSGPGKLTQALGVSGAHNGLPLDDPPFVLLARRGTADVIAGPRIGITKAIDLPWRYGLKGSPFLSKPMTAA